MGLLHTLSQADGEGGNRPTNASEVRSLGLSSTKVTDAGLKELKELKQLTTLSLVNTKVTDAGLKELKNLKQLTFVDLDSARVTDKTLTVLREIGLLHALPNARGENRYEKRPTNAAEVHSLELSITKVTDAGLKELKDLKQLTRLSLGGTQVTDEGLRELKDLKQLTSLGLEGTRVTDEGVADLKKALPNCKISR